MKYNSWWNWNHLRDAESLNNNEKKNIIVLYFVHLIFGLKQALIQLILVFASIIHALFPFAFNFKLLDIVVNQCIQLYKFLPDHPSWKKIKKEIK